MSEGEGSRRPPPGRRKASCEKHLECLFCNHLFSRYRDLETHMNTHTTERPHHCPQCDLYFSSGSRLWDHRQVVHMGVKRTCEFCGKEFTNISDLCEHRRRVHKEEWAEQKNNKGSRLNSLSNMVKNIVVNKKKEIKVKKKGKSEIIKKKTEKKRKKRKKKKESSEEDTTDSEISHLEEEEPPLVELTDTEEEQEVGGEVHQEEEECQLVEIIQAPPEKKMKRTELPSVMKVGQGNKRWECDICEKVFFRRDDYSLNRHKRNVHQDLYIVQKEPAVPLQMAPNPLALVVCEHEQASTIQLGNFNSVNSSSIASGSLKRVIKNYKNGTKVEPQVKRFWKCDICNKSFYRKDDYSLRRHKRTVHRDIFEQQGPRPPQPSSLSPQLPLSAQHLENEEVTPSSTETKSVKSKNDQRKNFQKLTQMRNKRKKVWVENKQKRLWQCDHCGCTFYGRNRASLNRHLKNVHNIDLQENEEGDPNLKSQPQESQHLLVVLTEDINNKTDEENANIKEDQSDEEYLPNLPMKPKSKKKRRNGVMPKWKKKQIFKCDLCGKSFCCKDRRTLNRHLKNVHRDNGNSVISSPTCEPLLPAPSTSSKPPPSKKMKSSERGVVASVRKSQKKVRSKTSKKITARSRELGGKSGVTEDGTNIWRCYVCAKEYIRRDRYNLTRHIITKHLSGQDSSEEEEDDLDLEDHSMEEAVTEDEEENEQEEDEDTDNEENLRKYADFFANPPSPIPPPAPPEFAAQFQFPPPIKLLNFPLENKFSKPQRVWDPGFFIHMNRYTPDKPQNSSIVHPVTAPPTDSREELEVFEDGDEEDEPEVEENYDSKECPKCKKVFKKKWTLNRHLKSQRDCVSRKMREDNPVKIIYWCCFCKKVMGQWKKSPAAKHMAFAHRFEDTPEDWEAYRISAESSHNGGTRRNFPDVSCAFCEFKSTSKETLRQHIMERHSERLIMTPAELINLENEESNAGEEDVNITTEQSKTEDNQNQVPGHGLPSSLPSEVQTIKSPVPLPTKLESLPTMVPSIETVPEAQLLAVDSASPQSPTPLPPVQLQAPPPNPVTVESYSSNQSVENPHHEVLPESRNYQTSFPETQSEFSLVQSEKSTEQTHSPPSTRNGFPENQPQYRSSTWLHTYTTGLKSFFNQFQLPQSTTQLELPPPVLPSQSCEGGAANGIFTSPFASTIVTSETHSQNIGSPVPSTTEPEMKSPQKSFSSAVDEEVDIDDLDSEVDTVVSSQSSGVICTSNTSTENPATSPSSQENRASSPNPLSAYVSTTPPKNSPTSSPPPHEYSAPLSQLPQENVSCVGNSPPSQENLGYTSPAPPSSPTHLSMPLPENNDPKSPLVSDKSVHLSPESPLSPPPAEYSSPVHPEPEYSVPLPPPPVEYLAHLSPAAPQSPATWSKPLKDDSEDSSSESSDNSEIPATTLLESSVISMSSRPPPEFSASSTTPTSLEASCHLSQESLAPSSPLLPPPEIVTAPSPPPETDACSPAAVVNDSTPSAPEYSAHSSTSPSEHSASASPLHDDKAVFSPPQSTEMYLEPSSSEKLLLPQPSRENSRLSSPITADYSSVLPSPENAASSPQPAQPSPSEDEASSSQLHLEGSASSQQPLSENASCSTQLPSETLLKERKKNLRSPRKKIKLSATPIPGSSKPISTIPAQTEKQVANSPDATPSPVKADATQENEEVSTTVLPNIPTSAESCDDDDQSSPSNLVELQITSPRHPPSPPIATGSTSPPPSTECQPDRVKHKCQKCRKVHPNDSSLAIHQKILGKHCHLLTDMKSAKRRSILYYCVFCQKKFTNDQQPQQDFFLARHIAGVHTFHLYASNADNGKNGPRKQFSCAFCGEKDKERDNVRKHITEEHYEMLGRPRDMKSETAEDLWQNILNHAGGGITQEGGGGPSSSAGNRKCPLCEQNPFNDRYKMVRHIAREHKQKSGFGAVDSTKTDGLECAFCGYKAKRNEIKKMIRHIQDKHVQLLDQSTTANMEESQPMYMEETQTIDLEEIPSVSEDEAKQAVEFEHEAVVLKETMVIEEDEIESL